LLQKPPKTTGESPDTISHCWGLEMRMMLKQGKKTKSNEEKDPICETPLATFRFLSGSQLRVRLVHAGILPCVGASAWLLCQG